MTRLHNNTTSSRLPRWRGRLDRGDRAARRGFSLVELLIVIGVILALVVTTLPAFRAIRESNRESGSLNALSAAFNTARALAIRDGRDTGVLFRFDTTRQITSLQLVQVDVTLSEAEGGSGGNRMTGASVFVPVEGQAPIELPRGAGVFGYGYGASRDDRNGSPANPDDRAMWYADLGLLYRSSSGRRANLDPWLFPRTDPFVFVTQGGSITNTSVERLDSFVVRFSPDGTVVTNAEQLRVPRYNSAEGGDGFLDVRDPDDPEYTEHARSWSPEIFQVGPVDRLLDEVQIRSVPFLVVVDLYEIREQLGIDLPWFVLGAGYSGFGDERTDSNGNNVFDQYEIDEWINRNATIVTFNRFTGAMMRDDKNDS